MAFHFNNIRTNWIRNYELNTDRIGMDIDSHQQIRTLLNFDPPINVEFDRMLIHNNDHRIWMGIAPYDSDIYFGKEISNTDISKIWMGADPHLQS